MVPKGWASEKPEQSLKIVGGAAFSSKDATNHGVRWLKIANVGIGQVTWDDSSFLPEEFVDKHPSFVLNEGDIVVALTRPTLGNKLKIARIGPNDSGALLNQRVGKLQTSDRLDDEFLFHLFRTSEVAHRINTSLLGTDPPNLSIKVLGDFHILIPPLTEQRKIADILSTWDVAIEKTEALLANAKAQKRALMQSLLTGKRRFPEFEGHPWKEVRSSEVFETVSKKKNSNEPLLAVTQDMGIVRRDELERRVVMPDGSTDGYKLVVPGNFVISLRSFQGGLEYSSVRGLVSPAYHVLQPKLEICDAFYRHYFKSYDFVGHLAVAIIGIRDGKQISYSDFSFLKIPAPSLIEQRQISDVLDVAEAEVETLKTKANRLRTEKKALMQQLLTGKRRVKV